MSSMNTGYVSLNKPLDKYIVHNGKLVELTKNELTNAINIPLGMGKAQLYQEHLDGPMISKEEAMEKYPEYFI